MDPFLYNLDSILAQIECAPFTLGYYTLRFYTEEGKPVDKTTNDVREFYLYPSGGTFRDAFFNIVWYDARFDTYRGFVPPHCNEKHAPEHP